VGTVPVVSDDNGKQRLNEREIEDEELKDWRVLFDALHARFRTEDFETGLKLVKKIGKAADKADHHPDVDLSYTKVDVRLSSHDVGGVTSRDIELARKISELADDMDLEAAPGELSVIELALDTPDHEEIKPFWAAVLGYEGSKDIPDELTDPNGTRTTLWFQEAPDAGEEVSQRFHLDVRVPPDVAEERVKAALEAGGTLVTDERAPTVWVLADKYGNKACVTTWLGRVPEDEVSEGDAAGNIDSDDDDSGSDTRSDKKADSGSDGSDDKAKPSAGTKTSGESDRGSDESSANESGSAPPTGPASTAPAT
jgi:4a-hydroxytetrahydrobiopterin dehydratase